MPTPKGFKHSDETKRKISEAQKGRVFSNVTRQKMSEAQKGHIPWNKGICHSEESKRKMSEAKRGKTPSAETRRKLSESMKDRVFSEEHRQKISKSLKGRIFSEEHKRKISENAKGRTHSQEAKEKMSNSRTGKKNHFYGKKHSAETKEKISAAHTGVELSKKHREKMSKASKRLWQDAGYRHRRIEATKRYIAEHPGEWGFLPLVGKNEKVLLDRIEDRCGFEIIRQYPALHYSIDGYILDMNIAIEIDEKKHNIPTVKAKDAKRQQEIEIALGCVFCRIPDTEKHPEKFFMDFLNDLS